MTPPDFRPLLNLISDRVRALPLLIVYLTDGCNSRCVTCDIWKLPRRNMSLALVEQLADEFPRLGVKDVLLSGGEAIQHPDWPKIAARFRRAGARVNLLTNGLLLKKQAQAVIDNVDQLTVSLDGGIPETYHAIRGVDALPTILDGMRRCADGGVPITTRTTVQHANFRELGAIVDVAKQAGASKVSFLAVDVSSVQAFGPRFEGEMIPLNTHQPPSPALSADDLPEFAAILDDFERTHAADFASRLIAESPGKLRGLHRYFEAVHGLRPFEPPRCNAPHLSMVVEVDGSLRSCFFLPRVGTLEGGALVEALNSPAAVAMRSAYRTGQRAECERCVCPLYRGPHRLLSAALG